MTASKTIPVALVERTLRSVVELLVRRDYVGLERLTHSVRLTACEIEAAVKDYGRTLVMPPPGAFSRVDIVPIRATAPAAYSIRFRLFTEQDGESDLEIQATFVEGGSPGVMKIEIDNVLVA